MSASRFLCALPCVVLLALAFAVAPARAQESAREEFDAAFAKTKELEKQAKYAEAAKYYERMAELAPVVFGPEHKYNIAILDNRAVLYYKMGQYAKAEPLFQRSLKIKEAQLGPDHPDVALSINNLAALYLEMGQHAKAVPLFQRSLKIREDKLGPDHNDTATALNNLASLYWTMGQYAKAEPLFQRSLKIREDKLGPDHLHLASSLNNLAALYREMGQHAKAEPLYERSLKIREDKLGLDHPEVAYVLNNLAWLYRYMGQYAKAEPLFQRALKIYEAKLGPDHPSVAVSLNNLAALYRGMGQYAKAEPLFQRSLKIKETQYGPDHSDTAVTLKDVALLYSLQERWTDASDNFQRQRRIVRKHVSTVLPILSEKEQLDFLEKKDEEAFHVALTLGLARADDPALAALSAGWLVNGKAVAHQSLAERALLERDAGDPARQPIVEELQAVRQQRAALTMSSPKTGQEDERLRQLAQLALRQQELERRLGQMGGAAGQQVRADPWIELGEIRKALPADAVLIDIARFKPRNFQAKEQDVHEGKAEKWRPARYVAWIVPPEQARREREASRERERPEANRERERPEIDSVRIVDLGEADKIEAAVKAVRLALREAQNPDRNKNPILQKGEPEAEKELLQPLAELSKLILEPLRPHIGAKKQWIISPDAALWLVPWAALPIQEPPLPPPQAGGKTEAPSPLTGRAGVGSKYAVEKHSIRYVVSGRDLVTLAAKVKSTRPMVMADPDYDLGLAAARAAAKELLTERVAVADLRGTSSSGALPMVNRLPGTAAEAKAIKPKLEQYAKDEVWVYKDKNAQEAVFKSFKNPKVLVLSTHGFFLEDQETADPNSPSGRREPAEGPSKSALLTKDGKLFENPLVRCGLLLAGCNDRENTPPGPPDVGGVGGVDEDGVLTGLEIVGTDLRGTELVVLSACETGLGQVRNGEGVAGLRQAFQLAGAQAVVATLWQIPDRDSALLMTEFFDQLAAGKSKSDSLREAQLARIKARRERNGAAHPFFWAAFTLTGQ